MENPFTKTGRIVFGVVFGIFGLLHLMNASQMAGMVPSWVPGGIFWVYLTGLAMLAAGISLDIEKQVELSTLLLAILLVIYVLTIHLPGVIGGDMMHFPGVLKDTALAAASLYISGIYRSTSDTES